MSTALLNLSENGELQKIHNRWLSKKKACRSQSEGSDQLHLQSFWGLFLICGVSCVVALLLYLFFILRKFKEHSAHQAPEPSSHGSSRTARLQTFLSFADQKEDKSRSKSKRKQRQNLTNGSDTLEIELGVSGQH